MKIRPWIVLLGCALLSGCYGEAQEVAQTENPNFQVELLFEHEGCRVYRFRDGNLHYYVRCLTGQTETITQTTHSAGKTSYRRDSSIKVRP